MFTLKLYISFHVFPQAQAVFRFPMEAWQYMWRLSACTCVNLCMCVQGSALCGSLIPLDAVILEDVTVCVSPEGQEYV